MKRFELVRSGFRPLAFDGELLAEVDGSHTPSGGEPIRWHEMAIYRTAGGEYVLSVSFFSRFGGEEEDHAVYHADSPATIEVALRDHAPIPSGVGYPPNGAFADKQARMAADIRRRYDGLVSELFAELGSEYAEVLA